MTWRLVLWPMIDARCKLLGQAGAPQVRVYSGVPITSQPSGKSVLESSPEILISSPHLFTSQPCDSLSGSQMRAQQRCRKASCAAPLYQQSVPSFHGCCLYLCQPALSLYIYTYIFYKPTGEKRKIRAKKRSFMLSAQSSSLTMHLFLSSSFQE